MRYPVRDFPIRNSLKAFFNNYILRKPTPVLLSMSLTHRCNARCPFCGFWKSMPTQEMSAEEVKKVLADAYELGCLTVALTGGEPLLRKDLPQILEYAKDTGLSTLLTTNGYLLSRKISQIYRNTDLISVSIDFPDTRHDKTRGLKGLLGKDIEGIKTAQEYGVSTNINSVITGTHSLQDVEALLDLAKRLNSGISFAPVMTLHECYDSKAYIGVLSSEGDEVIMKDWDVVSAIAERLLYHKRYDCRKILQNTKAYLELIKERGDFTCHLLALQVGVSPTGDVGALCPIGLHESNNLGNALQQNLKEIWHSERAERLREEFTKCKLTGRLGCYLLCVAELSLLYSKPSILFDYFRRVI